MRQLVVQVPRGRGREVADSARSCDGVNISISEAIGGEGEELDLVIAHLPNRRVGDFVDDVEALGEAHVSMMPTGVLTFRPPASEVPESMRSVTHRSPLEIIIGGLQSIGSWRGFLLYALLAGIVAWLAIFSNTIYVLIAAMLIAPFAGPAVNAALATARGDFTLLWRSLFRYFGAVVVTVAAAAALSLLLGQQNPTNLMAAITNISAVAVLLPLSAGAAAGVHLSQDERSSLVSGAAVGVLIAASLAPPAAVVGMAAAVGEWGMAGNAAFLLALQFVGINFAGALTFRFFGVRSEGPRYPRGNRAVSWSALALSLAALGGLVWWQLGSANPELERSTLERRARATALEVIRTDGEAYPVEVTARFTRPDIPGQNTLMLVVRVQPRRDSALGADALGERLVPAIQRAVREAYGDVTPLIDLRVLSPP